MTNLIYFIWGRIQKLSLKDIGNIFCHSFFFKLLHNKVIKYQILTLKDYSLNINWSCLHWNPSFSRHFETANDNWNMLMYANIFFLTSQPGKGRISVFGFVYFACENGRWQQNRRTRSTTVHVRNKSRRQNRKWWFGVWLINVDRRWSRWRVWSEKRLAT